jgi:hypothetical protein
MLRQLFAIRRQSWSTMWWMKGDPSPVFRQIYASGPLRQPRFSPVTIFLMPLILDPTPDTTHLSGTCKVLRVIPTPILQTDIV